MTLITTNTHTGDSDTVSTFNSSIDNTYKLYIFKFININPATDEANFSFQANAVGASGYAEDMTTTVFRAYHNENDGSAGLGYDTAYDQDNDDAAYQKLSYYQANDADSSLSGELYLFNPSNTTYVKHFYCTTNFMEEASGAQRTRNMFTAGYINNTAAIDDIEFKMDSGNMDGVIKMYGVG